MFKKTPKGIFLKCLGENEAYLAVSNVHIRACGAHQVRHKMRWLLCQKGIYWTMMLKDCIEFSKGCQYYQIHSGIKHVPTRELHAIVKPWPFRGWSLDLISVIRMALSKIYKYILFDIDYFTKWI